MFITNGKDSQGMEKCRKQAQANANSSGKSWMIFQDTNSNWCVERNSPTAQNVIAVIHPERGTQPK